MEKQESKEKQSNDEPKSVNNLTMNETEDSEIKETKEDEKVWPKKPKVSMVPYSKCKVDQYLSILIYYICLYKKPIVFHHGIFDLLYIYDTFFKRLPDEYLEFVGELDKFWPDIYCTKHIVSNYHTMSLNTKQKLKVKKNKSKTSLPHVYHKFVLSSQQNLKRITIEEDILESIKAHKNSFKKIKTEDDPFTSDNSHSAGYDSMITGVAFFFLKEYLCVQLKDQFYSIKREIAIQENKIIKTTIDEWVQEVLEHNMKRRLFSFRVGGINLNLPSCESEEFNVLHNEKFAGNSFLVKMKRKEDVKEVVEVVSCLHNVSLMLLEGVPVVFCGVGFTLKKETIEELRAKLLEHEMELVEYVNRGKILVG